MAVWQYVRHNLESPVTGSVVRLTMLFNQSHDLSGAWIAGHRDGGVSRAYCLNKDVYFDRFYSVPITSYPSTSEFKVRVTADAQNSEARFVRDRRGVLYLVFTKTVATIPSVYLCQSSDDGRTWSSPSVLISNGKHPTIAIGHDGTILFAAYVSGKLAVLRRNPGTLLGSEDSFNAKDQTGTDLAIQDDSFHLAPSFRSDAPWILHVLITGDTFTSDWISQDDGKTWKRLT